ncbi:glycoside hydrolase family 9 protein [Aquisalimonas asiatica]|uniref:Endoglucanase n=1 Tax=Aquisalimonas asiatica TaxID=406100 RepID=A0A1H8VTE7_9GAMM|nr:glycoside hydrolase family 9 protein [Aquisalimonas asiatica]SEP18625.1 endoglucanase [Aquisalimonas asiatica]
MTLDKGRHLRQVWAWAILAGATLLAGCTLGSLNADDNVQSSYGQQVKVDQVGYLPDAPKMGVVVVAEPATGFQVVSLGEREVVYSGTLSEPVDDESSGDTVQQADFSELRDTGRFVLEVDGVGQSYPFRISSDVYHGALVDTLRSYTLQRANFVIDDPLTGLYHGEAHMQDAEAEMYFSDDFHQEGETLDMLGGWYDAGDFGKYTTPGAISVAQLLLAYEWAPEAFTQGQMLFPEEVAEAAGDTDLPDLLVETQWKLDWLLKMQRPDGAAYHKVSGAEWPSMETTPEEDDQTRYVYGMSTYGTGILGGVMAMAARLYEPYDPDYAEQLLAAAKDAFEYLEANPEPYFREDEDQNSGSGPYDKHEDAEERFWVAAELFKTTGDARYERYLDEHLPDYFSEHPEAISWLDALALGHWAYLTADEPDPDRYEEVNQALMDSADAILEQVDRDGYNTALTPDQYTWASAKNAVALGNLLLMANAVSPDAAYEDAALDQIHYVLGRNATSYSYLSGSGVQQVQNVHHRTWHATGVYIPGLLVGGPNDHPGGDPLQKELIEGGDVPPAKAYLDELPSYSTNEYAIDYTAPLVFALAYFDRFERDQADD